MKGKLRGDRGTLLMDFTHGLDDKHIPLLAQYPSVPKTTMAPPSFKARPETRVCTNPHNRSAVLTSNLLSTPCR